MKRIDKSVECGILAEQIYCKVENLQKVLNYLYKESPWIRRDPFQRFIYLVKEKQIYL